MLTTTREGGRVNYEPDEDEEARRECCAEAGADLFQAAEMLAVMTDRFAREWHDEGLAEVVRARDALRQAFVAVLLLVGPGDCTVAGRMAKRAVGTGFDFLRGELRAGRTIAADVLAQTWETISRDA